MRYLKDGLFCFIFIALTATNVLAWEVTTHQQLTRMAVTGDERAENLDFFVRTFDLGEEDYSKEGKIKLFWDSEQASGSYLYVAEALTSKPSVRENLAVDINLENRYIGLIEAGSILEDTIVSDVGINYTHARFVRHFYDPHKTECYGLHLPGASGTCA